MRNPHAVRPWQHVLDALSGYLWLGGRLLDGSTADLAGAWNFGPEPGTAMSVQALTERALQAWGRGEWEDLSEPDAPYESPFLGLSIDKAKRELGWRPVYAVDDAVDANSAWYRRAESAMDDMYAFTAAQILEYVELAGEVGAVWAAGDSR